MLKVLGDCLRRAGKRVKDFFFEKKETKRPLNAPMAHSEILVQEKIADRVPTNEAITTGSRRLKKRKRIIAPLDYIPSFVADLPDSIDSKVVYVVGDPGFEWQAAFQCPCGCLEIIHLNLLEHASPSWVVKSQGKGLVSIYPSINRKIGCKSHFFIKKGRVQWH